MPAGSSSFRTRPATGAAPRSWRRTRTACDAIVLTNGAKVIELRRDATNHLWRMIRPLQARADSDRITDALQQLQAAQAAQFVTDDPKADLTTFGLQPADLDLWLESRDQFHFRPPHRQKRDE